MGRGGETTGRDLLYGRRRAESGNISSLEPDARSLALLSELERQLEQGSWSRPLELANRFRQSFAQDEPPPALARLRRAMSVRLAREYAIAALADSSAAAAEQELELMALAAEAELRALAGERRLTERLLRSLHFDDAALLADPAGPHAWAKAGELAEVLRARVFAGLDGGDPGEGRETLALLGRTASDNGRHAEAWRAPALRSLAEQVARSICLADPELPPGKGWAVDGKLVGLAEVGAFYGKLLELEVPASEVEHAGLDAARVALGRELLGLPDAHDPEAIRLDLPEELESPLTEQARNAIALDVAERTAELETEELWRRLLRGVKVADFDRSEAPRPPLREVANYLIQLHQGQMDGITLAEVRNSLARLLVQRARRGDYTE